MKGLQQPLQETKHLSHIENEDIMGIKEAQTKHTHYIFRRNFSFIQCGYNLLHLLNCPILQHNQSHKILNSLFFENLQTIQNRGRQWVLAQMASQTEVASESIMHMFQEPLGECVTSNLKKKKSALRLPSLFYYIQNPSKEQEFLFRGFVKKAVM